MKIFREIWLPLFILLSACSIDTNKSDYDIPNPDNGPKDQGKATDTPTLPEEDGDTPDEDGPSTDTETATAVEEAESDKVNPNTDPAPDTEETSASDTNTEEQEAPDLDTTRAEGHGCDIPSGLLAPQKGESGYALFDFGGIINDPEDSSPSRGEGTFEIKLRGRVLPLEVESMTAYYSYTLPGVVIKGYSVPDPATLDLLYLEARIETSDLIEMHRYGDDYFDIFAPPTGYESLTNVRVYEGRQNQNREIEKLCLSAIPGTTGDDTLSDLWPVWVCNTEIDWTNNVGLFFGMAGNLAMFDDRDTIEDAYGMRCVCANGAGSWRNCDPGTPEAYGLLKFNFKFGGGATDWWSGYVYDEEKLVDGDEFDFDYAGKEHPAGIWQQYWSPILGGLNISARTTDPTDGHTMYRFGELIVPQSNATVIALVSKDTRHKRFVVRQHSFDSSDLLGESKAGYWINAYLPDGIVPGSQVAFGLGRDKGKLFVYDPNGRNCIMAVACAGLVRVLGTSSDLGAKEGGKLHLKTEVDTYDTRQSVQLWHPAELPADCDWATYLAESAQPANISICDKI